MNDEQIIALFFERSELAIAEAKDKYRNYCQRIAFNVLRNYEDSEECVSDTFLQAWNSIPPQKPDILKSFLGKITRNLALNKYKYNTAQKRNSEHLETLLKELSDCLPTSEDPAQLVEEGFIVDCLNRFLSLQNERTRKIFIRRYWYMDSIREISDHFGISKSSAKMTLLRTRTSLKAFLEREGVVI